MGDSAQSVPMRPYDPMAALKELEESQASKDHIFQQNRWSKPVSLEFKDLTFSVNGKQILNGVSGAATPGHVVAIMGPSGAGKTSLLDLLAGRISAAKGYSISGTVTINGEKRDYDSFRQMSAYVVQSDYFFPELTVKETIAFSATLRLPKTMSQEKKMQRVDQVFI
jgi:ABC-type multidrug transport system ATPase subunit